MHAGRILMHQCHVPCQMCPFAAPLGQYEHARGGGRSTRFARELVGQELLGMVEWWVAPDGLTRDVSLQKGVGSTVILASHVSVIAVVVACVACGVNNERTMCCIQTTKLSTVEHPVSFVSS